VSIAVQFKRKQNNKFSTKSHNSIPQQIQSERTLKDGANSQQLRPIISKFYHGIHQCKKRIQPKDMNQIKRQEINGIDIASHA